MPITESRRSQRRNYLGGSDIAGVFDCDPYNSPIGVWMEKVFDIEPQAPNEAMEIGNEHEGPLLDWAARHPDVQGAYPGLKIQKNQFRSYKKDKLLGASLDAQGFRQENGNKIFLPVGFEAKSTSEWEGWDVEHTDQIPEHNLLQCHHQILVADLEVVFVPVLLVCFGRLARRLYKVERNDDICEKIARYGPAWWRKYVEPKIPPPATKAPPSLKLLRRIQRVEGSAVDLCPRLVDTWCDLKAQRLDCSKQEAEALSRILEVLQDAEIGLLPDGRKFQYRTEKAADVIDRKTLRSKYPAVYAEVSTPGTRKVPRIKRLICTET